ncbi:PaaI family thioesterase [Pseudooceanicola pacificus]|jgi:acyl-coenzyme A thioesterase PaaI-like protein|nr:PaaI family thioesterase [Pseudooceanicola pacificus]
MAEDTADTLMHPPGEGWAPVDDTGFIGHVGPLWQRQDKDGVPILAFTSDEHHRNSNGVVQGGMLMTLADRGMGRMARHEVQGPVATVSFSYDFMAAAPIGRFIELHPRIAKRTGSLLFMESVLISDGEVLGRAHGVWKKLRTVPVEGYGNKPI